MATEITATVQRALIGELGSLRDQVRQLVLDLTKAQLWRKPIHPGNSVGHLILHLTGNLNHFVGAQLGNTGYVRDREREFTEVRHPSKEDLLENLDGAVAICRQVVEKLSADEMTAPHPESRFGTVLATLVHLVAHFAIHRGQMSYIVRLVKS